MFQAARTRIALAAAALAIVATGFAPAATSLAAPLTPSLEREYVVAKPDVRAQYVSSQTVTSHFPGKAQLPDKVYMRDTYSVKNIGKDPSGIIMLKGECYSLVGQYYSFQLVQTVPGLTAGGSTTVTFDCQDGWGSRLTIGTLGDINPSNNVASHNWP